VKVNGARLFYRRYGARSAGPPVVLIHGATVDGATDWGSLAPAIGLRREVIVPDCRGHGRSTNPDGGYRFARLAKDVAGLIRALGHERAHIVGHSNGGNVALVTLVEFPDVVATCVIQAANAYVSADLRESEPANFDPDRVAREWPDWRDEMVRLHGRWQGPDYWRSLLEMTVAEIVASPAYGSADLSTVDLPTLVIEGRRDQVNARSGHGAFIADHIPAAERWQPDAGHAVHTELAASWLLRVEEFWDRRGSTVREAVWRIGREVDRRLTVHEIAVGSDDGHPAVTGAVLGRGQEQALRAAVAGTGADVAVRVLGEGARSAVAVGGVTDVLERPTDPGTRVTQVLFGERLWLLDEEGRFTRVRLEGDGSIGWIATGPAVAELAGHERRPTHRLWSDDATAHATPGGEVVGRLPFGARLRLDAEDGDWAGIAADGDSLFWVRGRDLRAIDDIVSLGAALARFRRFVGVPYLWGGRTPWGFDCSGLTQAFLAEIGRFVPRDADQQWAAGIPVEGDPEAGDLVFYGAVDPAHAGRIGHVGILLDATAMLHAWGTSGAVAIATIRGVEDGPDGRRMLGARRFPPGVATP
jgi:pimeloyl-ACP methyl ester carboxylesterase